MILAEFEARLKADQEAVGVPFFSAKVGWSDIELYGDA
jgi:hypothetical protein